MKSLDMFQANASENFIAAIRITSARLQIHLEGPRVTLRLLNCDSIAGLVRLCSACGP